MSEGKINNSSSSNNSSSGIGTGSSPPNSSGTNPSSGNGTRSSPSSKETKKSSSGNGNRNSSSSTNSPLENSNVIISSSSSSNNSSSGIGTGSSPPNSSGTIPSLVNSNRSSPSSKATKKSSSRIITGISPSSTVSTISPLASSTSSTKLQRSNNSFINFNKLKPLSNLQNNIYKDIFFKTKSHISINIKDIIGTFKKPKNEKGKFNYSNNEKSILNYNEKSGIKFIKKIANLFREFINEKYSIIRELKKQKFANITMYYIDHFDDSLNRYLVYIYYKKTDLYFIYNNNENETRLYDIGDLYNHNIRNIISSKSNLINLDKSPPPPIINITLPNIKLFNPSFNVKKHLANSPPPLPP
jgi:hypothetical protein